MVPVEKFTVRMPMVRLELATLDYKPSALATELYSSKAIAGKELSLSSWCIASLYIYHFSTVIDFSSENKLNSFPAKAMDKLNSFPAIAFELYSSMARALGL